MNLKRSSCLVLLLLATASLPAHAGFEWKKPGAAPAAPMPTPAQQLFAPPPATAQPQQQQQDMGAVVSGFGKDMPLAIALQQVVPAGYQYSFGNGVNPGTQVSWQGGRPWRQVLSDMLASKMLAFDTRGNVVVVTALQKQMPVPQPMPAFAAPAVTATEMPAPKKILWDQPKRPEKIVWTKEKEQDAVNWNEAETERHAPKPVMKAAAKQQVRDAQLDALTKENRDLKERLARDAGMSPLSLTTPPPKKQPMPTISSKVVDVAEVPAAVPVSTPALSTQEKTVEPVAAPTVAKSVTNTGEPAPIATASGKKEASSSGGLFSFFKLKKREVPTATSTTAPTTAPAAAPKEEPRMAGSEPLVAKPAAAAPVAPQLQSAAAAKPAPAVAPKPQWVATKGATLRDTLSAWAKTAGVEFYWTIDYDYRLRDDVALDGKFEDAVGKMLDRYKSIRPQPYGRFYRGDQKTLVVASYDSQ